MTELRLTADTRGNLVLTISLSTASDVAHVQRVDGDLVELELGADEPVQIIVLADADTLRAVLTDSLAQLEAIR